MGPPMAPLGDALPAVAEQVAPSVPLCRVQNQKLCLAVDLKAQSLVGYTELDVLFPSTTDAPPILGLHATGLHISAISVEGAQARFQHLAPHPGEIRVRTIQQVYAATQESNSQTLGEKVYRDYVRLLQAEEAPELLIHIPEVLQEAGASHEPLPGGVVDAIVASGAPAAEPAEAGVKSEPDQTEGETGVGTDEQVAADGRVAVDGPELEKDGKGEVNSEFDAAANSLAIGVGPEEGVGDAMDVDGGDKINTEPGLSEMRTPEKKRGEEKEKKGGSAKKTKEGKGGEKDTEKGAEASGKLLCVRIDFRVTHPRSGVYFHTNVMHTNSQLRRARCWFPCADTTDHPHSFDLEVTADPHLMAISSGELLYQAFTDLNEQRKVWVYRVAAPTSPGLISLAVGPFVVLPDVQAPAITHLCMPGQLKKLRQTVHFLHTAFSTYEEYLGLPFPFPSYVQVFLDTEAAYESTHMGFSTALLSAHLLVDDRVIDQTTATRIKLAALLARQWFGAFITADSSADVWLVDGLAAFLTDVFVRRHLGNNELRYRRYKEFEAVCLADVDGAAPLSVPILDDSDGAKSQSVRLEDLERSSVRTWKAKAVLAMLEKQVGPDSFQKCVQELVTQAKDGRRLGRAVSTRDFQTILRKVGAQDKRALKEFFARWVKSPGCPRISVAFNYIRRRNLLEVALVRTATAVADPAVLAASSGGKAAPDLSDINPESGWPGSLPIRVQELDGSFDHLVALSGDRYDKAELQCHSKLTAAKKLILLKEGKGGKRRGKPGRKKKGAPVEAEDEEELGGPLRATAGGTDGKEHNVDSAVMWVRVNPDSDVLAELHVRQTEHMWIAQLEKDRDVVAQVDAISALGALSRPTFAAMNALYNCMADGRVYCHVRAEAARALGRTAKESTNWAGLDMLLKFYRSRRYDPDVGLPKPNDFSDFRDYFVDQAVPGAVASVRGADGCTPLEGVEFLVELLKHNDNSANSFSDGNWLAVVIEAVGAAQYSAQTRAQQLPKLLKQLDKQLQYDRLLPSYNHVVTVSCLRTLARLACQMPRDQTLKERLQVLLLQHTRGCQTFKVRQAAFRSLMDLEACWAGPSAALELALKASDKGEPAKVLTRLLTYASRLWAPSVEASASAENARPGMCRLEALVTSRRGWRDVRPRHVAFMLLQQRDNRPATLYRMYTQHGIDLPARAPPPPVAQAAPPSARDDSHVPLLVKLRRAGSESVPEPSTKTDGQKILVRLPKPGGMPAPSSTQDSLKVRLKLPGHPRSSHLGPDASEGAGTSVRQPVERSEATERSSQPVIASARVDDVTQEVSTGMRAGSVEGEPGEAGPPRPYVELPRPTARKNRSTTARVRRTVSLLHPLFMDVKTEEGEAVEAGSAGLDDLDTAEADRKSRGPSVEVLASPAAGTELEDLSKKEAELKERFTRIQAELAKEAGGEVSGKQEPDEEAALRARLAEKEAELAALGADVSKGQAREDGEIEDEEEGEVRAAKESRVGPPLAPELAEDGGNTVDGEAGALSIEKKGEQRTQSAKSQKKGEKDKDRKKKKKKKEKKERREEERSEKRRANGGDEKGLTQDGAQAASKEHQKIGEARATDLVEEGEVGSPKAPEAGKRRSNESGEKVFEKVEDEEEGEFRPGGDGDAGDHDERGAPDAVVRTEVAAGQALGHRKGEERESGKNVPVVSAAIGGHADAGAGVSKVGFKVKIRTTGAPSRKDDASVQVPVRREDKVVAIEKEEAAAGAAPKTELAVTSPEKRAPKAEERAVKPEPTAKAGPLKLKLCLKSGGGTDKGGAGKSIGETGRPSPGVDSQGRVWKGVKLEAGLLAGETAIPPAHLEPESSDEDRGEGKSRDRHKGLSSEERRLRKAKKEEKRRRKEEKKRRKSQGVEGREEATAGGDERPAPTGSESPAKRAGPSARVGGNDTRNAETDAIDSVQNSERGPTSFEERRDAGAQAVSLKRGVRGPGATCSETEGRVLGKRGRDEERGVEVPPRTDARKTEVGEKADSPAEQDRKRRRVSEGRGERRVGGAIGLETSDGGARVERSQSRGPASPEEKKRHRLQKVRDVLERERGSASPREKGTGEEAVVGRRPREARPGESPEEKARNAARSAAAAERAGGDEPEERGVEARRLSAAQGFPEKEGGERAEAEGQRRTETDEKRRDRKPSSDRVKKEGYRDERAGGRGPEIAPQRAPRASEWTGLVQKEKQVASDADRVGERTDADKKRKQNRDDKEPVKQKKKMKSLDALLEEPSSLIPEPTMGIVKAEAPVEGVREPLPQPAKPNFKLKIKLPKPKPKD